MKNSKQKLVVLISRGFDDERASVAWSVANGGVKSGQEVSIFLVSSGVDWVRKGAAEKARLNAEDPTIGEMMRDVLASGSTISVCPPCAKVRGYEADDLIDGVQIVGSSTVHEALLSGGNALTF